MERLMPLSASISTRLRHQHESLREITGDLAEIALKQRVNPDKWSAFEHIAHLAAYQPAFISRLEKIATAPTPSFERYVAEKDPQFYACLDKPLAALWELISAQAAQINTILAQTNEAGLLRTGLHPKYGLLTVTQWTEFYLLHEAHHLFTLFMLTQDLRKARM
ncbi:DinB family protein [Flavitalea sp. BT771]|uniref:DinB family protein n=1 Tax=Flavitalea sp. BT771 TaxID=3063329 RepID=UPI0026E2EE70|nr:DinB family protein [Flavitalea sp. BT771]MDO6433426.1 DinB family protein [Flavitalea sp. BT771]MDV6222669.1 DinB family protein [Flavitalea sp. BT771]